LDADNLSAKAAKQILVGNDDDADATAAMAFEADCNTATNQSTTLAKVEADGNVILFVNDPVGEDSSSAAQNVTGPAARSTAAFEPPSDEVYFSDGQLWIFINGSYNNAQDIAQGMIAYVEPHQLSVNRNGSVYTVMYDNLADGTPPAAVESGTSVDVKVLLTGQWIDIDSDNLIDIRAEVPVILNSIPVGGFQPPGSGTASGSLNRNYHTSAWFVADDEP
jgi:hypothetical protein